MKFLFFKLAFVLLFLSLTLHGAKAEKKLLKVSNRCGNQGGGAYCEKIGKKGYCCSKYGYCGKDSFACSKLNGCQNGPCVNDVPDQDDQKKEEDLGYKVVVNTLNFPTPVCKNC